jgi:hypothetical protein
MGGRRDSASATWWLWAAFTSASQIGAQTTLAYLEVMRLEFAHDLPERHLPSPNLLEGIADSIEQGVDGLALPEFTSSEALEKRFIECCEVDSRLELGDLLLAS